MCEVVCALISSVYIKGKSSRKHLAKFRTSFIPVEKKSVYRYTHTPIYIHTLTWSPKRFLLFTHPFSWAVIKLHFILIKTSTSDGLGPVSIHNCARFCGKARTGPWGENTIICACSILFFLSLSPILLSIIHFRCSIWDKEQSCQLGEFVARYSEYLDPECSILWIFRAECTCKTFFV